MKIGPRVARTSPAFVILAGVASLALAAGCGPNTVASTLTITVEAETGVIGIATLDALVSTPSGGSVTETFVPSPGPDFTFPVTLTPIDVASLSGTATVDVDGLDGASVLFASGAANTSITEGANSVTVVLSVVGGEFCGDGVANAQEDCDGGDLGGDDCASLGFAGGVLACDATCSFNTAGCTGGGVCGDGTVDAGEQCDDGNTADGDGCSSACQTEPMTCGDGTCDMAGGETCTNCVVDCSGDPACAGPVCGDGTIDVGEDCEGANLGGETCVGLGFTGGSLACDGACAFDTTACTGGGVCGDGTIDPGEDCEGANLNMQDCTTLGMGFTGGTLTCTAGCGFDVTACTAPACGDGTIDPGEDCDGMNLNMNDCTTLGMGFTGGTLTCTGACGFDVTACNVDLCFGVDCSGLTDMCNTGMCDPTTGACFAMPVSDGTACNDGNNCDTGDTCLIGTCTAGAPVDCSALTDQCNTGTCNPASGACFAAPVADGTGCVDSDLCSTGDQCTMGVCAGTGTVDCTALDDACNTGTCDVTTGGCFAAALPDGTTCDDADVCTDTDICTMGACGGTSIGNGCDIYSAFIGGFIDIRTVGTLLPTADADDANEVVVLPFTFDYFGTAFTDIAVHSNGYIVPGGTGLGSDFSNDPIPSTLAPNNVIAAFWDDLNPSSNGDIYVHFRGVSPNQIAIIQWTDVALFGNGASRLNFEAILHENGNIQFLYDVSTAGTSTGDLNLGSSATVGIEDGSGNGGLQYSNNMSLVTPGLIVNFTSDGLGGYTMATDNNHVGRWIDVRETGTLAAAVSGCDDCTEAVPLSIPFNFFGGAYGSGTFVPNAHISSNGFIQLGATGTSDLSNTSLPSTGSPPLLIACMHDDLDLGDSALANVHYETVGVAPNRIFIVQYTDVDHWPGAVETTVNDRSTFQVHLYETTNVIKCLYGPHRGPTAESLGSGATAGIQDATQLIGVEASFNIGDLGQGAVISFVPLSDTDTTSYTFHGPHDIFPDIKRDAAVMTLPMVSTVDDSTDPATLGFTFNYYGTDFTDIYVTDNGYLGFGAPSADFSNDTIPSTSAPNNIIAAFWDDLDPDANALAEAFVLTAGPPGAQIFTVMWQSSDFFNGATPPDMDVTFAVELWEATGEIHVYYGAMIEVGAQVQYEGSSATIGIENGTGMSGIEIGSSDDRTTLSGSHFVFIPN